MNNNFSRYFSSFLVFAYTFHYTAVSAQTGLVPNCSPNCGFNDLMLLISNIINFIFVMILPLTAFWMVYAGYLYIASAGNPGLRTEALDRIKNLGIGILLIVIAWLLVATLFDALEVQCAYRLIGNCTP
jgi:hypothetical protein